MTRFDTFKKNYNEAIENIKGCLDMNKDYEQECRHLLQWLFDTKHNPYGIFSSEAWAGSMETANGFASLCNMIHHAMVDDGDICFPVVNDQPRIAFANKHDTEFNLKYILSETEYNWHVNGFAGMKKEFEVTYLNDAYEFTKAKDAYEYESIKHCFLMDAAKQGRAFAIEHYSKNYDFFDMAWCDEIEATKQEYKALWGYRED